MAIKTALVGHGYLGKFHAQKIQACQEAELVAIVDVLESSHEEIRNLHPGVIVSTSFAEIVEKIDAVVIATPTSFHKEVLGEALRAGKHVFCEKPLVDSMKAFEEIRTAAEDAKSVIQVGHSERFHACWGKFEGWKNWEFASFKRLAPFKNRATDVDVVSDLMIHDIDLMLWGAGEKPVTVEAWGHKSITSTWDHMYAIFGFSEGRKAVIEVARGWPHEERSAAFSDSRGNTEVNLKDCKISIAVHDCLTCDVEIIEYDRRDHLLLEHQAFYHAIGTGARVPVTLQDGVNAVRLIDLVIESAEKKKALEICWEN